MTDSEPIKSTLSRKRIWLGGGVFVAGWLLPVLVPVVATTDWSTTFKGVASGLLLLGLPEVFTIVAIAVLGRDGFNFVKQKLFSVFHKSFATKSVSRTRYKLGLVLFSVTIAVGFILPYSSVVIPQLQSVVFELSLTLGSLLVISTIILGADFWEKLRKLFEVPK